MKIILAKSNGFCAGVARAIKMAEQHPNAVIIGGGIINNPSVTKRLQDEFGISPEPNEMAITSGTAIIRSQGTSPAIEKELISRGVKLIDATCPFVKNVQAQIKKLTDEGFHIILMGDKHHYEVKGLIGYTNGDNVDIVADMTELKNLLPIPHKKIALASQTTKDINLLNQMSTFLSENNIEHDLHDTTCKAVVNRQTEALDISKTIDIAIVVGGKISSNTKLLVDTMSPNCKTYFIESANEINPEWFLGAMSCGIVGGASTPAYIIQEVVDVIPKHTI